MTACEVMLIAKGGFFALPNIRVERARGRAATGRLTEADDLLEVVLAGGADSRLTLAGALAAARAEGAALTLTEAVEWVRRARGTRKRPSGGWESLTPPPSHASWRWSPRG